MPSLHRKAYQSALEWYNDNGADEALLDHPQDRKLAGKPKALAANAQPKRAGASSSPDSQTPLLGKSDARAEAVKLAKSCTTLEELRAAIAGFDGLAVKKTATNMVFSDGNPEAPLMLIGEAPGADEDRQGKPFVGASGQLLDKILACIGISRSNEDAAESIYISNILNWRPPGNRTPNASEIAVSLPFIERHIQIAAPKLLIFCGGVPAKALLGRETSISRLRRKWHDYRPVTSELKEPKSGPVPALVTYHPAYLLRTPVQKKAVWADMLMLQEKREEIKA